MRKYTQKELREMVARGMAENITNAGNDERAKILDEENYLSQIGYSSGIYGCNGMLLQGNKIGKCYAITARTQAIYIFG